MSICYTHTFVEVFPQALLIYQHTVDGNPVILRKMYTAAKLVQPFENRIQLQSDYTPISHH